MNDTTLTVLGLGAVVLLVVLNGVFVAAEFAFVAVRRTRIEQLAAAGQGRARALLGTLTNLDSTIATTQLGITMAGLALGWIGEPALGSIIEPPISALIGGFAADAVSKVVAVVIAFVIVTFTVIVFGELAPKSIALARAESVALWLAAPIGIFGSVFRPFVWTMNQAGRRVVRLLGVTPASERTTEGLDTEELELVIQASARAGMLSASELLLARRALEFGEIQADQIMIPRTEVVAIDAASGLDEVVDLVERTRHARYPVFEDDLDHILGVLDAKDLISLLRRDESDWRRLIRPAVAIPESVSVEVAIATMRGRQTQMAVLVDEHGGTSGIITADEVLHRLLGRWQGGGKGQSGTDLVRPLTGGNILLSGLALIADVEEATGAELADENYDTVGGFIMARLGRIPRVGDRVDVPGYTFKVTGMDGRRVDRVLCVRNDLAGAGQDEARAATRS